MSLEELGGEELDSILTSIKKLLGITEYDDSFDTDVILDINSAITILNQLGVGVNGFIIRDKDPTWDEFLTNGEPLELVKTYIFIKVKLMFDPPASSTILESYERQAREYEWRLQVAADPV